jgi:ribokinase
MNSSNLSLPSIVVVGSANIDLMLSVPRLPRPGETVSGRDFITAPGGKGANQAVAAARQGAAVAFVGCVGDDANGAQLTDALTASGVDIEHLHRTPGTTTGVALILSDSSGENCIALHPGANLRLDASHVDSAAKSIAAARLLVCQLESPIDTVEHAISIARRHGVATLLNPAPAQALPPGLIRGLDFLAPNESEASMLTGIEVTDITSATSAAQALLEMGVDTVLLTMGASGVLVARVDRVAHFPSERVTAVDTTGAGDTFVGAFAAAWARGESLDGAVQAALAASAISVQKRGAQASMPWLNPSAPRRDLSR